jgi:hypothetical protein
MGFHRSTLSQGGTAEGPITIQTDNANALLIEQVDGDDVAVFDTSGFGAATFTNHNDGDTGFGLTLFQNSASPASEDVAGFISFDGNDDGTAQSTYATIYGEIDDTTAGSEIGLLSFTVADGAGSEGGILLSADGGTGVSSIEAFDDDIELLFLTNADVGAPHIIFQPGGTVAFNIASETISDTTACDPEVGTTIFTGNGTANTLGDGSQSGQMKILLHITGAGATDVNITNFLHDAAGLQLALKGAVTLLWGGTSWFILGGDGYTLG